MAIFSKLGSTCWATNPRNLCHTVLSVYSGRVALRNVTQLCKVPNRTVRELLDVIKKKQNLLAESYKDELVESPKRAQITRAIGEYLNCVQLSSTYTDWELGEAINARLFGTRRNHLELLKTYGVPIRTLSRWVKRF